MILISSGGRVWIASCHCDMRKGMQGLPLLVQEGLGRDPFKGDVFVFRGRSGLITINVKLRMDKVHYSLNLSKDVGAAAASREAASMPTGARLTRSITARIPVCPRSAVTSQ